MRIRSTAGLREILRWRRPSLWFLVIRVAEKVALAQPRIRARLQSCPKGLYFFHPEQTEQGPRGALLLRFVGCPLVREGSAFLTCSAVSLAVCFCAWPAAIPA